MMGTDTKMISSSLFEQVS